MSVATTRGEELPPRSKRTYSQTNQDSPQTYGFKFSKEKTPATLRTMGLNIGNLNARGEGNKYEQIRPLINKYDVDVMLMQETGLAWQNVKIEHRLSEKITGWWKETPR